MIKLTEGVSEKILACAKEEFLEKGYSDASLRIIAAKADTTTGSIYSRFGGKEGLFSAIVKPVAEEFTDIFLKYQQNFHNMDADKQANSLSEYSSSGMMELLEYMYEHFEEFQLLLDASYGTKFQNFVEHLAEIETEYTYKFMNALQAQDGDANKSTQKVPEEFIHIMTRARFESFFEVIRHKMEKEAAVQYIELQEKFHYNGWKSILDFE